jgi:hypothetical protein
VIETSNRTHNNLEGISSLAITKRAAHDPRVG